MGLLDMDPVTMGLLSMGAGILGAAPGKPVGYALGQGALQGLTGYRQANEDNITNSLKKLQLNQLERSLATKAAMGEALRRSNGVRGNVQSLVPWAPGKATGSMPSLQASGFQDSTSAPSQADMMLSAAREAGDFDAFQEAMKLKMEEKKLAPKFATEARTVMGPDGRPMLIQMADDGTTQPIRGGYGPAEKLGVVNTGQRQVFYDPYTGQQRAALANSLSPDAAASNALGWANNRLSADRIEFDRQQANRPQFKDGYWVQPPRPGQSAGTVTETPLSAPPKGSAQYQQQASSKAMDLIGEAEKLLEKTTNSYFGTGVDLAGELIGISTPGAQSGAKLKALQGALMMAQPRMEGPQSDKDTALYRDMAGQIGDNNIPAETRRAALSAIKLLHQKYSGQESATQNAGSDLVAAARAEMARRGIK